VDEFGFNLSSQRRYGKAPAGQRAIQIAPVKLEVNVSVVAAIERSTGFVIYEHKENIFDSLRFMTFVQRLAGYYQTLQIHKVVFVMDNC
jgi:hypothetical protein